MEEGKDVIRFMVNPSTNIHIPTVRNRGHIMLLIHRSYLMSTTNSTNFQGQQWTGSGNQNIQRSHGKLCLLKTYQPVMGWSWGCCTCSSTMESAYSPMYQMAWEDLGLSRAADSRRGEEPHASLCRALQGLKCSCGSLMIHLLETRSALCDSSHS